MRLNPADAEQAEKLRRQLADRKARREAASAPDTAATAQKVDAAIARDSIFEALRAKRQQRPVVPSREEADAQGCTPPSLFLFELALGQKPSIAGVEYPAQPDPLKKVAYELLPAFLAEHGDRYPVKPSFLLRIWLDALKDGMGTDDKGFMEGWQLQRLVHEIARQGVQFNKLVMQAIAKRQLSEDAHTADVLSAAFNQRDSSRYVFFQTTNPENDAELAAHPQPWSAFALYPEHFPSDVEMPARMLHAIDAAVQARFELEDGFCSACARYVAGELLHIAQFSRRHGIPVQPQHFWDWVYRYSAQHILTASPHQDDVHDPKQQRKPERKHDFRNHIDDGTDGIDGGLNVAITKSVAEPTASDLTAAQSDIDGPQPEPVPSEPWQTFDLY